MSPTRIVLPPRHKPFADELLAVTGIDSLSNLFVVMLTRYGHHLKASWSISQPSAGQLSCPEPITYSTTQPSATPGQLYNHLNEPITEPEPEPEPIDPIIAHIAKHVDRF